MKVVIDTNYNTTKTPQIKIIKADPDDDKFIECASALKAEVVITGDKAIEALEHYGQIKFPINRMPSVDRTDIVNLKYNFKSIKKII